MKSFYFKILPFVKKNIVSNFINHNKNVFKIEKNKNKSWQFELRAIY